MSFKQNKVALIRKYLSIAVIIIAVTVLFGWVFDLLILKSILSGYISMNPITAVNLILIASGILFIKDGSKSHQIILRTIAFFVAVLVGLKFADFFLFTEFKPDRLLFSNSLGNNKMAEPTVFNFLFLVTALFFLSIKKELAFSISQFFSLLCLSLSAIYICAYLFNLNSIIGAMAGTPMALHTAISFILLSIALLFAKPHWGFMKTIMAPSIGGMITRKALPLIILIPFVVGYLRIRGQNDGLYNDEFGAAILVVTTAVLCAIIMWYYGKVLNKIHSEWKNTELNLRLSESKFSNAFSFSGVGMALVSVKGEWIDVNESLCKLLGYSKEEMYRLTFQDITHPEDLSRDVGFFNELLQGEINTYQTEKRYLHKDGKIVWVSLTSSLVRDENGLIRFFVSQIADISQTKKLFVELETKNEVLSITTKDLENKISQLEEFNRIVSHNLRGPAGSIQMLADMAIEAVSEIERIELLGMLKKSSSSLNETLSELISVLEVSLNKNIPFEDCNILEIIQKIEDMLKGEIISKKAQIIIKLESPVVKYPKVYLESIFYNMISNALKYSKQNEPPIIEISSKIENDKTRISFNDNGLGIDLNRYGNQIFKLNKVFHKGFDSKGLGLFITKNQIETFGGNIFVDSKPDHGSEFTITL